MGVLFLSTQLQNMVNSVYIVLSKDKDKKHLLKSLCMVICLCLLLLFNLEDSRDWKYRQTSASAFISMCISHCTLSPSTRSFCISAIKKHDGPNLKPGQKSPSVNNTDIKQTHIAYTFTHACMCCMYNADIIYNHLQSPSKSCPVLCDLTAGHCGILITAVIVFYVYGAGSDPTLCSCSY